MPWERTKVIQEIRTGTPARATSLNLTQALAKAMGSKTMGVAEATAAVQKTGYRTTSNNFRTQVNIALIKGPFKRVGRGEYAAK